MGVEKRAKGQVVYEEGGFGDKYYVTIMGSVLLKTSYMDAGSKHYKTVGWKGTGVGMGDEALSSNKVGYKQTCVAAEPCIFATIFRNDYLRLMKADEINAQIDKFWRALIHPHYENMYMVDWTSYRDVHLRIAKTISFWSDTREEHGFDMEAAEQAAAEDWAEDLKAHALNGGERVQMLSYERFRQALYMLVRGHIWTLHSRT